MQLRAGDDALREERDKDRAAARQIVQGITNAPIDQNRVVLGALPLAIGELRKSAGQAKGVDLM